MNKNKLIRNDYSIYWLVAFCIMQLVFFTVGPWFVRSNPKFNSLETLTWGQLFQWSYFKHPPLAPWLSALFHQAIGSVDFSLYLAAQLCIILSFIGVYRLSRLYLNKRQSVLSVLMLSGIVFYSQAVEVFDQDILQIPLWCLLSLFVYIAVQESNPLYWFISGIVLGLGFLAKYQIILLLIAIGVALIFTRQGRRQLLTLGPWLGLATAIFLLLPHLMWLYKSNFVTITYVNNNYLNIHDTRDLQLYFKPFLRFIFNLIGNCLPFILMYFGLIWRNSLHTDRINFKAPYEFQAQDDYIQFKKIYLYCIALGPSLMTALTGFFISDVPPRWATTYYSWLPLLVFFQFNPIITEKHFKKIAIGCIGVFLLFWVIRMTYTITIPLHHPYSDNFMDELIPFQGVMNKASNLWESTYHVKLKYLGGEHYDVVSANAYSSVASIPFSNLNFHENIWINPQELQKKGAMVLINPEQPKSIAIKEKLKITYPNYVFLGTFTFVAKTLIYQSQTKPAVFEFYAIPPKDY